MNYTIEYYIEEFSGTLQYTTANGTTNTVTGFRIFGAGGTYNATSSTHMSILLDMVPYNVLDCVNK